MEALLVFDKDTQQTLTLLPKPEIRKFTRGKNGCLTCRARRKKCDEHKPVCNGCSRNHLLCSWPTPSTHRKHPANTSPSWWPKLQYDPSAQRLFQHYVERTASMIAAVNFTDKPFIKHLLPLASTNDGVLHAILALSSSHLSFRDETSTALARSHYAVALRSVKYEVTNVGKGNRNECLNLLVLLLLLCQFEVPIEYADMNQGVDGNMQGAILYHLKACKAILPMAQRLLQSMDETFVCFLLEQYAYLQIVANNVGLTTEPNEVNLSIIKELTGSIRLLICTANNHGFMFGYAYELFELIPQIAQFAHKQAITSPRHEDAELIKEFCDFELRILEWEPHPRSPETLQPISKELDNMACTAGLIYQHALLIFLRIALNGRGLPADHLMVQIDHNCSEFLELLKSLPLDSTLWTTLLWAVLTTGSCLTKVEDQQLLASSLRHQGHEMHGSRRVLMVLGWVWGNCKDNEKFYGPYGIDEVLRLNNVQLSFA
ncbi:hypothetical protein OIDMADRAFT_160506 [Oidiodendron maius Zn]|uniref:Zn(2)-C6 fungal-type domain-containing protein n=1 Tax=Oidiodendron maius (strain Zn) TaxID=913774 RepID=A0A0C3DLL0_OIDMZ|nr:hypothetical protein OIDMADRAFT_160506 [Oidiodendron maius Zn]